MTRGSIHTEEDNQKEHRHIQPGQKPAQPQQRPIRREVTGGILLVLALCVCVGYFGTSGLFIDWLAVLLRGLFGYGYWLTAPVILLAGLTLLIHRGRPVVLRTTCALLTPWLTERCSMCCFARRCSPLPWG